MTDKEVMDEENGGVSPTTKDGTFVDYVAPKKDIPPPAKWKLAFLIFTGVYFSFWFQTEAGLVPWMIRTFRLRPDLALFVFLWIAIGCLSYGYLEVLTFIFRIKINDEWYGIESWLKQPRVKWVHEYQNFFVVCLRILITTLEDGLAIFDAPPPPQPPLPMAFELQKHHHDEVMLRIEQHIQKGRVHEYEIIRDRLAEALALEANPGVLNIERESHEDTGYCVMHITFRSLDDLNAFMESPVRKRLIRQINPLLDTPPQIQLLKERTLPDALTDLITQQGHSVPDRPAKKWKVWFLSTLSIYLVVKFTNHALPHYLSAWNLDEAHDRIQTLVTIAINIFLGSYCMTPLVSMIFGRWLVRPEKDEEGDLREPWRTLNDGFETIWGQVAICMIFYGSLAIAWIV